MKPLKAALAVVTISLFVACHNTTDHANAGNNNNRAASTQPTAAPTQTAPAETPDEFANARGDYSRFCIRCHKPDGSGGLFELEDGAKLKVPSLREGHALKHTEKELARQINNGGEGMPAFKNRLEPERIDALVRFIRHDFQGQSAPATSDSNAHSNSSASATPAH